MADPRGIPESFQKEMYYLISKFLESSPCSEASEVLKRELEVKQLVPPRYDWTGQVHQKTIRDMDTEYDYVAPDHLMRLCYNFCSLAQGTQSSTAPTVRTLVGRGSYSFFKSKDKLNRGHRDSLVHLIQKSRIGRSSPFVSSVGIHERLCPNMKFLRRTLGHLSSVYCLLFDRTGTLVITGADDLLVKCWSMMDGRLVHTFRGASAEISDLTISHDNRLLAAGSCDKNIRVWCMYTAAPLAVLTRHHGIITAINFCPFPLNESNDYYLASTSGDGTVSFWKYRYNEHQVAEFEDQPTRFHEKIRPGQAQMICASFSPGGVFFCVGSADHNVRVYQMNCPEGPRRILEEEAHTDRVDSIQWCNRPDLRFVSGSKDGTARIWKFSQKKWSSLVLNMKTGDNSVRSSSAGGQNTSNAPGPLVAQRRTQNSGANGASTSDQASSSEYRVTMVTWSADDTKVITAVSNNTLKIWDSQAGKLLSTLNGHQDEIYVLEPHPKVSHLLLSAAHDGHMMIWDLKTSTCIFKHRNMVDQGHAAIYDAKWTPDGMTIAASDSHGHLFFVGHGSSDRYDRLPTELFFHTDYRPLLRDSYQNVVDEQTQVPPHLLPPPLLVDSEGSPYPPYIQRMVRGREKMSDTDALVPGSLDEEQQPQNNIDHGHSNDSNLSASTPEPERSDTDRGGPEFRIDQNRDGAVAGPSNDGPSNDFMQPPPPPHRFILKRNNSKQTEVESHLTQNRAYSVYESAMFITESSKVVFDHDYARPSPAKKEKTKPGSRGRDRDRSQQQQQPRRPARDDDDDDDEEEEQNDNENNSDDVTSDCTLDDSDFTTSETTTEDDLSMHSDWGSDDENQPGAMDQDAPSSSSARKKASPSKQRKTKRKAAHKSMEKMLRPSDITDDYIPSPWLSETLPRKTPYFPQIGDVLMYFRQGHERYIDLVKQRKVYQVNMKEQEWMKKKALGEHSLVKVVGVHFVIRPPRLCVLKLQVLNPVSMEPSGETFSIKYHDMNDVVDFLILHQVYETSMKKQWKQGDRIRCQIDDRWWKGTVSKVENKDSPFLSIYCHWDNGEKEHLSPWDIEGLDEDTAVIPDGSQVEPEQLNLVYRPSLEEWNGHDRESECSRISEALETIMSLAIAEPFNYPVDLTSYPEYMLDVEYPMDFNLIKSRIDNRFYRRFAAMEYDLNYVHENAESFNKPRSDIVKNAKILTKLALEIVRDPTNTKDDVSRVYHGLAESFEWSSGGEAANESTVILKPRKRKPSKHESPPNLNPKKWKHDCNELLNEMMSNPLSLPFREPVSGIEFPDYHRFITTPMDLSTVRESLHIGDYSSPVDFQKDVQLIFRNSKEYNTDSKSKVLSMTIKLEDWFSEKFADVIEDWRRTNRRIKLAKIKHKNKKAAREDDSPRRRPKGKGKGKGKGQSNRIQRRRRQSDDSDEESETEEETDQSEEDEVKKPRKPAPRRRVIVPKDSSEDEQPTKKTDNELHPQPCSSSTASRATRRSEPEVEDSAGPTTSRRMSMRAPKPSMRYRDEDSDDAPRRGLTRAKKPTSFKEEGSEDEGEARPSRRPLRRSAMLPKSESDESEKEAASSRPQRQRKAPVQDNYKYSDLSDEEEDVPIAKRRSKVEPKKEEESIEEPLEENNDEEDEDDVPLAARKQTGRTARTSVKNEDPSEDEVEEAKRPVRAKRRIKSDSEFEGENDEEEEDDEEVLPQRRRNGMRQRRPLRAKKGQLEEDSSEDDFSPTLARKRPTQRGSEEESSEEESSEESEATTSDSSESSRPKRRTRRSAGKRNRHKSSSEEEDERPAAKLRNRNARVPARGTRSSPPEKSRKRTRRPMNYNESDDEDGSSARENRRPQRRAASKRARFSDDDEDEEELLRNRVTVSSRGRVRKPNPRVI